MTTLLRSQQELATSAPPVAECFGMLVDSVDEYAIFLLDPDGRVASWNAGAERIKGYRAEEVLGRHCSIFYVHEDITAEKPARDLARAAREGRHTEEAPRVRKDGTHFYAKITLTALRDAQGRLTGFGKVTQDVTRLRETIEALRQSEERMRLMVEAVSELRELNEDLERRVQQRTSDLTAANSELDGFSYSISHDLRAPLRALDGFSRLLLDMTRGKLNEQEQDYLRRIRSAAQRMAQLTDALLTLSRLTRMPIEPKPTDVSQLAAAIVSDLRQSAPNREVEVVIAPDMQARVDVRLARAAFENVLRNAWKFTRDVAKPRIEVGAAPDHGEMIFFVQDNGVGFDPALKSKLFLPFQRLHRAKDFEGSGIGLATVSRIVQRHGGRIWADSALGQGATFHFSFGKAP